MKQPANKGCEQAEVQHQCLATAELCSPIQQKESHASPEATMAAETLDPEQIKQQFSNLRRKEAAAVAKTS